jgi:hypothetical protein
VLRDRARPGTDGQTGATWITYASLISGQEGVFARQLQASGKPAGTTAVWKVYLSAQATKVDVLALVTQHGSNSDAAYWDAQVPQP